MSWKGGGGLVISRIYRSTPHAVVYLLSRNANSFLDLPSQPRWRSPPFKHVLLKAHDSRRPAADASKTLRSPGRLTPVVSSLDQQASPSTFYNTALCNANPKKKAKVLAPLDAEKLSTKSNNRSSCLVYLSGVCLWWIVERRGGSKEHHTTAATHASSYVVALEGDKRPVPVIAFTPQNANPSSLVSGPPCLAGWPCRKRP